MLLNTLKKLLFDLFWIGRLDALAQDHDTGIAQFLRWLGRSVLGFYVIFLILSLVQLALSPSIKSAGVFLAVAVGVPLVYRSVIWFQIRINRL